MNLSATINSRVANERATNEQVSSGRTSESVTIGNTDDRSRGAEARVKRTLENMGVNVEALPSKVIAELSKFSKEEITFLVQLNDRIDHSGTENSEVHGYVLF